MRGLWIMLACASCGRIAFDPSGDAGADVVVEPSTRAHLYMLTNATQIAIFDVDADGELTRATPPAFDLGVIATYIVGARDRLYACAAGTLYTLAIDRDTGALSVVDTDATASRPQMLALHPNGRWLYVNGDGGGNGIFGYQLDADGMPTAMPTGPWTYATLGGFGIEVHPFGRWLYGIGYDTNVYVFAVSQTDGSLMLQPAVPWDTTDSSPWGASIDASGNFGFIWPDLSGGVPAFTFDQQTGAMTTTPGSKFGSHGNTTMSAAMDRTRTRLFMANQGDGTFTVTAYAVSSTGTLQDLAGSPVNTLQLGDAIAVTTSPVGDDVYVAMQGVTIDALIVHYKASATTLTEVAGHSVSGIARAGVMAVVEIP